MKDIVGQVVSRDGLYLKVECPQAAPHLRVLFLAPYQARSAQIGDRVRLAYRTTASMGAWVVAEVLSCNADGGEVDLLPR